jgi:hypothetical protein
VIDVLGSREVGTLFVEGDDGNMHHAPFSTHVELLRAKVETPGAKDVALVVVTTLERDVQPLVRYVLGDLVQIAEAVAGNGAAIGRYTSVAPIRSVEGTIDDAIVRPDGAVDCASRDDRAIGSGPRAYQVSQLEPAAVEVEVIGGSTARVTEALAPLLTGMRISARSATAIGVEPNGKYRTTRRRLPLSLSAAFEACEGV